MNRHAVTGLLAQVGLLLLRHLQLEISCVQLGQHVTLLGLIASLDIHFADST